MKQRNVALSTVLVLVVAAGFAFAATESDSALETAGAEPAEEAAVEEAEPAEEAAAEEAEPAEEAAAEEAEPAEEAAAEEAEPAEEAAMEEAEPAEEAPVEEAEAEAEGAVKTCRLDVQGMHCGGCAVRGQRALEGVKGVKSAKVSFPDKEAVVEYDADETSPEELIAALAATRLRAKEKE
ncbi:MAG: heavy-metal-associated domain-containing protein [Acidobacteriota bacterium]|nr:MAG: heavy-metal-associated domain-containing protein [Acidobacteriota bacterium]